MAEQYETVADELEAMINGTHETEEVTPDEIEDEIAGTDADDNNEDTEGVDAPTEDPADDEDTNDLDDGLGEDTPDDADDTDGEEDPENTQVDESNLTGDGEGDDDTPLDDEGDKDDTSEGDTKDSNDGENTDTPETDYKKQYEELMSKNQELQGFYDQVTADFKANGKMVKGFTDPKKIIQSNQMAAGYGEKMAGFKKYRPFMAPLKERGMLDDLDKFNLAMNIIDGDKEALKQHIKNLEIDPVTDLDLDEGINYTGKNHASNETDLALDDMFERARSNGVEDKLNSVLFEQWDRQSAAELINDPESSRGIVDHISTGVYDAVMERVSENKRTDIDGLYSAKSNLVQYQIAAKELKDEYDRDMAAQQQQTEAQQAEEQARLQKEAEAAAEAKRQADLIAQQEYKAKVAKNKKAEEARKKAASVSKRKSKPAPKKEFDPMELDGDKFQDYFNSLITG